MDGHPVLPRRTLRQTAFTGVLLLALAGCASVADRHAPAPGPAPTANADSRAVNPDIYAKAANESTPKAMRTGRYQLTTLDPSAGQRDLLRQTVTIDLPQSMRITVADGITHALRDSGLHLCARDARPFSDSLPAVHRELGPTTLATALQVLAGPAWRLNVDFVKRTVCFDRRAPADGPSADPRVVTTHGSTTQETSDE